MTEPFIPGTRSARQARIVQILASEKVTSQRELRDRLAGEGIVVTQATLSRDLDELGALKVKHSSGGQFYQVPEVPGDHASPQGARAFLDRWLVEVLTSVQQAGNQLVLRTPPGAAQLLASSLDRANLAGVIGTIGGDDTVLVITEDEHTAVELKNERSKLT